MILWVLQPTAFHAQEVSFEVGLRNFVALDINIRNGWLLLQRLSVQKLFADDHD